MIAIYSTQELLNLIKIPRAYLIQKINSQSANTNLNWMRNLQISLTKFSIDNKHLKDIQMDIVSIITEIERRTKKCMMEFYKKELITKYPELKINTLRLKMLAKEKTEKVIMKYMY